MPLLTPFDLAGLIFFIAAWVLYHVLTERPGQASTGLTATMNRARIAWMLNMAERDNRIVDSAIMGSLQNGTAFFASTSLLAVGGSAALLRAADDALKVFSDLPFGIAGSRGLWELKVLGLVGIFGYAFFKFSWAYRVFNYAAILVGATPPASAGTPEVRRKAALQAARMNIAAARHFSRGQRAFFFALAYLGWFVGPVVFIAATAAVLYVMWARQFRTDARAAVLQDEVLQNEDPNVPA